MTRSTAGRSGLAAEERPLPASTDILPGGDFPRWTSTELPPKAVWIGLGGFVGGVVAAIVLLIAANAAGLPDVALLIASMAGLWSGLLGACVVVSRRFGTGSLREDFGLHPRWRDLWQGLLASVAARVLGVVFVIPFVLLDPERVNPQPGLLDHLDRDLFTIVMVACVAIIGAPIVEELFFRGLLQRSLTARMGGPAAIGVQAFLFALVHLTPAAGIDNLLVLAVIFPAGVVFGLAARRRGLGTSMAAHALFNVVAVVVSIVVAT